MARLAGRIVGTGALLPRGEGAAEIVRMSVARDLRRRGVGRMILTRLVEQARRDGLRRVVLETTATWQEVIAFYLDCGFRITHTAAGDVYFALELMGDSSLVAHPQAHAALPLPNGVTGTTSMNMVVFPANGGKTPIYFIYLP